MHSRKRPGRRPARGVILVLVAVLAGIPQLAHGGDRTAVSGFAEWYALGLDGEPDTNAGRLVVSFDHALTRRASFAWELGIDHAGGEAEEPAQEVGLGQAFVGVSLGQSRLLRLGVFALPLGLTNEADEPTAFFGTQINPVESLILPAGWCESGAALGGKLGHGVAYDLAVTSGLSVALDGESAYLLREGVRSVRLPSAGNLAATGRLAWVASPGIQAASAWTPCLWRPTSRCVAALGGSGRCTRAGIWTTRRRPGRSRRPSAVATGSWAGTWNRSSGGLSAAFPGSWARSCGSPAGTTGRRIPRRAGTPGGTRGSTTGRSRTWS